MTPSQQDPFVYRAFSLLGSTIWFLWLGGMTFYISFVVPIGGKILGADVQGQVTSEILFYSNNLAYASGLWMFWVGWTRRQNAFLAASILFLVIQVLLSFLHLELNALMEGQPAAAFKDWKFYDLHRFYLWIVALQWLIAVVFHVRHQWQLSGSDFLARQYLIQGNVTSDSKPTQASAG